MPGMQGNTRVISDRLFSGCVNSLKKAVGAYYDTTLASAFRLTPIMLTPLRFQVVDDLLPPGKAKKQSLQRADQATAEGRCSVYDLRLDSRKRLGGGITIHRE